MIPNIKIPTYSVLNTNPNLFDNYENINRLILIGNGFDIAHGLKSSFKDFIVNYCYNLLQEFYHSMRYDDRLVSIGANIQIIFSNDGSKSLTLENALEKFIILKRNREINFKFKSNFFESIIEEIDNKNWVDIEIQYFDFLKRYLNNEQSVKSVNDDLNFIKSNFISYLKNEISKLSIRPNQDLHAQFEEPIFKFDTKPNTIKEKIEPESICFLNFNYSDLAKQYFNLVESSIYIPIHGEINGDGVNVQEPIFGFGDDMDPDYEKFESHKNEEIFKHIKSFKYLQFSHYRRLIDFIESKPFQVQIFGHSCGLSDRTLLNTIFENQNCISIKPFYHKNNDGKDDYEQRSYSIARHFRSKSELRIKVVNKEFCKPMVQPIMRV